MLGKGKLEQLIMLFILFSPFFYKFFNFPLLLLSIYFCFFLIIKNNSLRLTHNVMILILLVLIYNSSLLLASFLNIDSTTIKTSIPSDPCIPEYFSLKQIFVALLYNNVFFLFLILFFFCYQKRPSVWFKIERLIYIFGFINIVISILEVTHLDLHYKLMTIAGYDKINYFFVIRPVSIVMNSYLNAFFSALFSFWSVYFWFRTRKNIYLFLLILGFVGVIISGARYALLLLLISLSLYFVILRKFRLIIFIMSLMLFLTFFLSALNNSYIELFISIFKLSDKVGSANLHKELFLETLKIFTDHLLGIGIGKADFGALNTIGNRAFDSESFLLTILLQGGFQSLIIYLSIYLFLLSKLLSKKLYHLFSFSFAVLIVSLINIQILQSITATAIVAFVHLPGLFGRSYKYGQGLRYYS